MEPFFLLWRRKWIYWILGSGVVRLHSIQFTYQRKHLYAAASRCFNLMFNFIERKREREKEKNRYGFGNTWSITCMRCNKCKYTDAASVTLIFSSQLNFKLREYMQLDIEVWKLIIISSKSESALGEEEKLALIWKFDW